MLVPVAIVRGVPVTVVQVVHVVLMLDHVVTAGFGVLVLVGGVFLVLGRLALVEVVTVLAVQVPVVDVVDVVAVLDREVPAAAAVLVLGCGVVDGVDRCRAH